MNVLVIDGQGGKLGRKLADEIKKMLPDCSLTAVGTNSTATQYMLSGGSCDKVATGENAVVVACRTAHLIVGPIGIAIADSMLGEITPLMANSVASSAATRVLIPMNLCGTYVAGVCKSSSVILEDALKYIRDLF